MGKVTSAARKADKTPTKRKLKARGQKILTDMFKPGTFSRKIDTTTVTNGSFFLTNGITF